VFAALQARERSVHALRAQFVATATQGSESRRADGVLLVQRPDRVRLRLVSPFGLTVLDYTSAGGQTRLLLPLEDRTLDGTAGATDAAASPADFGRLLLRLGDEPGAQCSARAAEAAVVVDCVGADGTLVRQATIDPATATVVRDVGFARGDPQVTMELGDYRVVDGVPLPFRLRLAYPRSGATTEIQVRAYAVNPEIEERVFVLPPPGGA